MLSAAFMLKTFLYQYSEHIGHALTIAILVALWLRRLHKEYRLFVFVMLAGIVNDVGVTILLPYSYSWAFYYQKGMSLAESALIILLLFKIFGDVLNASALPVSKTRFVQMNIGFLLVAGVYCALVPNAETYVWYRAIYVLQQAVMVMEIGLLGSLCVLSLMFGFYWNRMNFGIAMGYGFYALVSLLSVSLRAAFGPTWHTVSSFLVVTSWELAALVWVAYAWRSQEEPALNIEKLPRAEWEKTLDVFRVADAHVLERPTKAL